jgi:beta-glucosidase/6-phospho-beta-glucosidase/beta-galactosidase
MSMTYTWEVTGLKNTSDGTVVQTYWKKTGTDSDGNVGTFSGATPFNNGDPDSDDYVAFAALTETDVLGWIQAIVVGDYETHVNGQIQKQIDQLAVSDADMPWAPTPDPADDAD